jgi:hypothetical protein
MFSQKIIKATDFRYARKEHENSRGILGVDGLETDKLQQTHNQVVWD